MLFEDHAGVVQFVFVVIGNDASTLVACIFTAYVCNHFPVWVETTTYGWCWFNFHYISKAAKVFKGGGNSKRKDYFSAREKYSKIEWGCEASPATIAAM